MKFEHIWQLLLIILGALASVYGGYWLGHQPEKSFNIVYTKDTNTNLKSLIGDTGKIEIRHEGKLLNELSNVSYMIANNTSKDFDKFKLYFEVSDKNNLPVFHNVKPPRAYPKDAISLLSKKDGIYIFELEYLNRTQSIYQGLSFTFYFAGNNPPKLTVKTGTKGIGIKKYERKVFSFIDIIYAFFTKLWWAFILAIIMIIISSRFDMAKSIIRKEIFSNSIKKTINNKNLGIDEQVEIIVKESKRIPSFINIVRRMFNNDST